MREGETLSQRPPNPKPAPPSDASLRAGPITEEWLRAVGFKWHQLERQPEKHWLLWIGDCLREGRMFASNEDLGVEVGFEKDGDHFLWLRTDLSGLYSRFLSLGHVKNIEQLITIIEAISRQAWNPENHFYGSMLTPQQAELCRKRDADMDRRRIARASRGVSQGEEGLRRHTLASVAGK